MKMPTTVTFLLFLPMMTLSCGDACQNPAGDDDPVQTLYFTSFETAADIEGWHGVGEGSLRDDPAPGGGERSALIGGGCIQPAAYILLDAQEEDAVYSLSCWGKLSDESQPGGIALATGETLEERTACGVRIETEYWRFYRSEDQIVCPAGQDMRIEIYIGGYIGASMFVDRLAVELVE